MKMLKIFSVVALSAMALAANAAVTASALITVKSASGNGTDKITLTEATDGAAIYEDGKDIPKIMNTTSDYSVNLYGVTSDNQNVSTLYTNDLKDVEIILVSNKLEAEYNLSFKNVIGDITLNIDGVDVAVTNGGTYGPITVPAGGTQKIIKVNPTPAVKSFCFRNNILEINGYKDDANVKIDDAAVAITSDNFTRPFTAAEAGRHKLTIDGKDYLFDAFPSNVTPVVP